MNFFERHKNLKRLRLQQPFRDNLLNLVTLTANLFELEEVNVTSVSGVIENHPKLRNFQFAVHEISKKFI